MSVAWLTVDDHGLSEVLGAAHLARHPHGLDDTSVDRLRCLVVRHSDLVHVLLLLLVLVHLGGVAAILAASLARC